MKKILLLLAVVLPFLLTSCGDDKDELSALEKELVGGWAIINEPGSDADDYHYVFKKERTGSRRHIENGNVKTDVSFYWALKGNKLTLDYGSGQQLVMEITLTINNLHVVYECTGVAQDYKRVVSTEE